MTHNPDQNITMPFPSEDTTILGDGKSEIPEEKRTAKRRQIAVYLAEMFDDDFRAAKGFYLGHAENIMQIVEA